MKLPINTSNKDKDNSLYTMCDNLQEVFSAISGPIVRDREMCQFINCSQRTL